MSNQKNLTLKLMPNGSNNAYKFSNFCQDFFVFDFENILRIKYLFETFIFIRGFSIGRGYFYSRRLIQHYTKVNGRLLFAGAEEIL